MSEPKIIAVLGATGLQGGGLVSAIRHDTSRRFRARAITRLPASETARALGVPTAYADPRDTASLRRAFEGVHGVFALAAYGTQEVASAAADAGVQHLVWSVQGNNAREALTAAEVPSTALRVPFLWDALIHGGLGPRRGADGELRISLPVTRQALPGIAAADVGHCAFAVFKAADAHLGATLALAGEQLDGEQMAAALSIALGEPVRHQPAAQQLPAADHLDARAVEESRRLHPALQSFGQWLARNRSAIARG
ncbi:NmrA family NAD(P)-binding protein [Sphaerotilaceae bacterium SBD11-9]